MADWIQAIGVVISLLIAGIRYYQIKRNAALESVKQMLNLLDEFDILVDDNFRFKVLESSAPGKERLVVDYHYMQQEVMTYEAEFRADLKELWRNLSAANFVLFNREAKNDNVKKTLNNAAVVQRELKTMIHQLQQENPEKIQSTKQETAESLYLFAQELTVLAKKEKLVSNTATLESLFTSLTYYVKTNQLIIDEIVNYTEKSIKIDKKDGKDFWYKGLWKFYSDEDEKEWLKLNVGITTIQKKLYNDIYHESSDTKILNDLVRNAVKSHTLLDDEFRKRKIALSRCKKGEAPQRIAPIEDIPYGSFMIQLVSHTKPRKDSTSTTGAQE